MESSHIHLNNFFLKCMFFRCGADFERFIRSLLKYNALEDFSKV
uniref:Uncharacterized protein n=1 Tax=Brassica campestris TaxID=3711 RepID=A0A3P6AGK5_BRACM|nr:unnamed protein product [Brassica rapa]